MSTLDAPRSSPSHADIVAGFLAVASIVLSLMALGLGLILEVDGRPARTAFVAIILSLVAARLSARYQSLALQGGTVRDVRVGCRDDDRGADQERAHLGRRQSRAGSAGDRYNTCLWRQST